MAFFQPRVLPEWTPRRFGFERTREVLTPTTSTSKISATA
jgi:hypothetical protein